VTHPLPPTRRTVRSTFDQGRDAGTSADAWRLADLGASCACFAPVSAGHMPEPNVRDDLAQWQAVTPGTARIGGADIRFMRSTAQQPTGPSANWLIQHISSGHDADLPRNIHFFERIQSYFRFFFLRE